MSGRNRPSLPTFLFALLLLAGASVLAAQDWKGRGRARGSVKDADGKPIAGATVSLRYNGAEGAGPSITTDKKGQWAYIGLITGDFGAVVTADGFVGVEASLRIDEYAAEAARPLDVRLRKAEQAPQNAEGDRLAQVLEAGNRKLQEKDYAGARASYQEVAAAVTDEKQKLSLEAAIAGTWLDEGKAPEARAAFEALLAKTEDPATRAGYLQRIARTFYLEKNIDASVATLEKALALQPNDVATLRLIIDILVASGREQQAEPYMAKLPAGEKVDPDALLNLGITAYNAGDMETAYQKFETVIRDHPDNADAWYYLGLAQLGRNKTAEAKAALEKFLQLAPKHKHAEEAKQFLSYLQQS